MPELSKRLGQRREGHLFIQGVPIQIPEVSMWRGQLQKERQIKFPAIFGTEYMLPDLNKALIPRSRTEGKKRRR